MVFHSLIAQCLPQKRGDTEISNRKKRSQGAIFRDYATTRREHAKVLREACGTACPYLT